MKPQVVQTVLLALMLVTTVNLRAQTTNTFPASGNVGIGTTSPGFIHGYVDKMLNVVGADSAGVAIRATNSGGHQYLWFAYTDGFLHLYDDTENKFRMSISSAGKVGIGITSPTHELTVNGTIRTREVIVDNTGWPDYVFAEDYRLTPLSAVEAHIKAQKHLPGIPSAAEIADHGVSVGEMQAKLLSKIEELTLHQIALAKEIDAQAVRIAQLERENAELRHR